METTQIALVDDHRLFRSGIASLIADLPQFKIILEAGDGEEFCNKINPYNLPRLVLLDINMPKMDGVTTAKWLRVHYPDIHIIILSMFEGAEKVLEMVKIGVRGYLLKDAEPQEFEQALIKVANNEFYYPAFVTKHLINNFNDHADNVKLNAREIQFLKLAGSELTYKEIADQMCISVRTVDGYRDQLFEKLHIKSRVGLVLYAAKNKIINF